VTAAPPEELYDGAPCGLVSSRPDGTIEVVNRTLLGWLGYDRADLVGRRTFQSLLSTGGRIYYETHYSPLLLMQDEISEIAVDLQRRDGSRLPALVSSALRRDDAGSPLRIDTTVYGASSRRGYERELLAARQQAERSTSRLGLLQALVADLAGATDRDELIEVVVRAGREAFGARGSMLWLLDRPARELVRLGSVSPANDPLMRRSPLDADLPQSVAVRTNDLVVVSSQEDADARFPLIAGMMRDAGRHTLVFAPLAGDDGALGAVAFGFSADRAVDAADLALLRTLCRQAGQAFLRAALYEENVASRRRADFLALVSRRLDERAGLRDRAEALIGLLVPAVAEQAAVTLVDEAGEPLLRAGEPPDGARTRVTLPLRALGSLTLGFTAPVPPGTLQHLTEIADTAGLAFENARLYDRERDNARVLQRGLLAGDPPDDPRIAVATFYRSGVDDLEVGGDWYDAFAIGADTVALVIGDVVGRGIAAASAMGQVRSAIRALAASGARPGALLDRLDRFVDRFEAGRMATVAYAELDLQSGELRYACAGHLPPLLISPDGKAVLLWEGRSAPLATLTYAGGRDEAVTTMSAGSRLLLYTDGLVETRSGKLDDALARLVALAADRSVSDLDALLTQLVAELAGSSHADDVCLLGVDRLG